MHRILFAILIAFCLVQPPPADERPNFIFFITDDIGWNDLGCYGNDFVKTPHLDALAARGARFTNAMLTISSCSPSRCSIITSRYPHNTGAPELHTSLPDSQFAFPMALKEAGYHTVLSGKHHMGSAVDPAFDKISGGKGPGKSDDWVDLLKARPEGKPFFAWFASADAHRDWQIDDKNHVYDPAEIEVPEFLYDGPKTRQDLADYYHEVSRTDTATGDLVEELKRQGIEDNTYIIYMTDNGRPFPRCKTRLYLSGIKTPLIVACPGKIEPSVTDSLVSSIDIGPTILDLAGVEKHPAMQGVSFVPVLKDPKSAVRDVAFAEQNWHVYQPHQRMVRTGDFQYIRKPFPEKMALSVESDDSFPAGEELWEKHKSGELNEKQQDIFQQPRPSEELYQVSDDPLQLTNLADKEELSGQMEEMRGLLNDWTKETGDTVPSDPTRDRVKVEGKKRGKDKHLEMPGDATRATGINEPGPVLLP